MPQFASIKTVITIGSAAICGIAAIVELSNWYWVQEAVPTDDPTVEVPVVQPLPEEQPELVAKADPKEVRVPDEPIHGDLSPLERRLFEKLAVSLQVLDCTPPLVLQGLEVDMQKTTASESRSGFDAVYLEGEARVGVDETTTMFRLLGTGKGPTAQMKAERMAIEQFMELLRADVQVMKICPKE